MKEKRSTEPMVGVVKTKAREVIRNIVIIQIIMN